MPVPIDCPSCKGSLLIPDALWQQHFAARVQRMTCKKCGNVVGIDGRNASPVASTIDPDSVPESQARRVVLHPPESELGAEQEPSAAKPGPPAKLWPMADLDDPNLWLRMARDPAPLQPPAPSSATGVGKLSRAERRRWIVVSNLAAVAVLAAAGWRWWGAGSAAPPVETAGPTPSAERATAAAPLVETAPAPPSLDEAGVDGAPAAAAPNADPASEASALQNSSASSTSPHDAVKLKEVLRWAVRNGKECHKWGRAAGTAELFITFSPSGKVSEAHLVGEPIASAPVARCILDYARAIFLPPFDGPPFTVARTITLR